MASFHCHQAAEKSLKALFVEGGSPNGLTLGLSCFRGSVRRG
ncbi:MAG: HEPN domain-containing protein [Candidatus Eremiobacteraeota bacterium]|nr:HEPN domain-containing protein [Candidatus Eremiobacteraeota bacterium]MCW5866183.1 HEPN domain-containing protein [Candidatus Eremiobacteraeota bacterium]